MPRLRTAEAPERYTQPNASRAVVVSSRDLPLHCPQPGSALWNSHPRVYLPIEDAPDRKIRCPYCSTEFRLEADGAAPP